MTAKKPTHLKMLDGNPGKTKINRNEPIPENNLCIPPADLSPQALEHWHKVLKESPPGLLKEADFAEVKLFCVALSIYDEAYEKVQETGTVVLSKLGVPYQNPYLSIMNKQAEIIRACAANLGLTPVARSRMSMPGGPGKGASPFAGFAPK